MTVQEAVDRIRAVRRLGQRYTTDYSGVEKRILSELTPLDFAEVAAELNKDVDPLAGIKRIPTGAAK